MDRARGADPAIRRAGSVALITSVAGDGRVHVILVIAGRGFISRHGQREPGPVRPGDA